MDDVQVENGYTRIANELLDAICESKFNATQLKIILFVMRYTYGFLRKTHPLSVKFVSSGIKISERFVSKEIQSLLNQNVLILERNFTGSSSRNIGINKNYKSWIFEVIPPNNSSSRTIVRPEQLFTLFPEQSFTSIPEQSFTQEKKKEKRKYICIDSTINFDLFYSAYPRKVSKANALKAWNKIEFFDGLFELIMEKLEQYKKTEQWTKNNGQFIPHPATWLNQKRWEDEISVDLSKKEDYNSKLREVKKGAYQL